MTFLSPDQGRVLPPPWALYRRVLARYWYYGYEAEDEVATVQTSSAKEINQLNNLVCFAYDSMRWQIMNRIC